MEVKKKKSAKQILINKIMKEKDIKKGLSKLSMKELKEFDDRGLKSSEWLDTIGSDEASINRESVLTLMTRKKLLKIVSAIRMKNYSHLKHQDLINLIATKYWGDFHHRWVVEAQKDKSLFPDWYYGVDNEKLDNPRKIGINKKVKKEKKEEVKYRMTEKKDDEEKHDTEKNLFEITPETLDTFLENEKKLSSKEPVETISNAMIMPFHMLSVLKKSKNDCSAGIRGRKLINIETTKALVNYPSSDEIDFIANSYLRCKKRNKMLVIPLNLNTKKRGGHQNMLIFNYHRKEVERFEPHGSKTRWKEVDSSKIDKSLIRRVINRINDKLPQNEKLTYISPEKVCPTGFKGYQSYESSIPSKDTNNVMIKDPRGYCLAWSYFYAFLRLKFPKPSASELIKDSFKILKTEPQQLREFIRGQTIDATNMFKSALGTELYQKLVKFGEISGKRIKLKGNEMIQDFKDTLELVYKKLNEYYIEAFKKYTSNVEPVEDTKEKVKEKTEEKKIKEDEPVEEKKQEEMTTKEGTKKLKEILSSKVSTKTKMKQALNTLFTTMKGDVKFYKENKANIDKLTSVEYRKKMGFE